jgi:hypothetical protein
MTRPEHRRPTTGSAALLDTAVRTLTGVRAAVLPSDIEDRP